MPTLEDLKNRHSVRSFTNKELSQDIINKMNAEITMINTHESGLKFSLCVNDNNPFRTFKQSYGFFKNANNYIACVVEPHYKHAYQRAGYFAQQLVMKAFSLGLGTCYVGGTYDRDAVSVMLKAGEKLLFVVLIGYENYEEKAPAIARMAYNMIHLKKMSVMDFLSTDEDRENVLRNNPLLADALNAVAVAPSSLNKRPARVKYEKGEISIYTENSDDKTMIDLGIAQYNFQAVYSGEWEWGNPSIFYPLEL